MDVERAGSHVGFLLFYVMPWYEALLRHWGESSFSSCRLLQSVWFPWHKTAMESWPGNHGSEKHSLPAKTGRKVQWWLLAPSDKCQTGIAFSSRASSAASICSQVYTCQFPEISFLSLTIIDIRLSDTYHVAIKGANSVTSHKWPGFFLDDMRINLVLAS